MNVTVLNAVLHTPRCPPELLPQLGGQISLHREVDLRDLRAILAAAGFPSFHGDLFAVCISVVGPDSEPLQRLMLPKGGLHGKVENTEALKKAAAAGLATPGH